MWQHIFPLNDTKKHDTQSLNCECNPIIKWEASIVIHNAWDIRELTEWLDSKKEDDEYVLHPTKPKVTVEELALIIHDYMENQIDLDLSDSLCMELAKEIYDKFGERLTKDD